MHLLLGVSNLAFWDLLFVPHGMLAVGWVTTVLHLTFVMLQLLALSGVTPMPQAEPRAQLKVSSTAAGASPRA